MTKLPVYLSTWLILLCPALLFAQNYSGPAMITMEDGRTLTGTATIREDESGFIKLFTQDGNEETIPTDEIDLIRFEKGLKYKKVRYTMEGKKKATGMARVLMQSDKIDLYKRSSPNTIYFVAADDSIHQLKSTFTDTVVSVKEQQSMGTSGRFRKHNKEYITTLMVLMSDRPDLFPDIQKTELSEKSLTKLILQYTNGELTYSGQAILDVQSPPNWIVYAQTGLVGSMLTDQSVTAGFGFEAGTQLYFKSTSRFSLKAGLEYARVDLTRQRPQTETETVDYWEHSHTLLNLSMQYDYVSKEKYILYFDILMASIGPYSNRYPQEYPLRTEDNTYYFLPRISPSLGAAFNIGERGLLFIEVNHLIQIGSVPRNLNIGFSYDLGQVTRL